VNKVRGGWELFVEMAGLVAIALLLMMLRWAAIERGRD
jgi:hypothetical protein